MWLGILDLRYIYQIAYKYYVLQMMTDDFYVLFCDSWSV
jgi:hypothetical protein